MIVVILLLVVVSVSFAVSALTEIVPARSRVVARQLQALQHRHTGAERGPSSSPVARVLEGARGVLLAVGARFQGKRNDPRSTRQLLTWAGYRHPEAISLYWGMRVTLLALLCSGVLLLSLAGGATLPQTFWGMTLAASFGLLLPPVLLRRRISTRRREIQANLPDALDLLVVCMEAGLGLNQAIVRMAGEIKHFSRATGDEFTLLNLEIRAGVARDQALRNLGERSDVAELRSLAAMLIQADRFGTSIAQALRVHADTLREKRRQRAEEMAAKTTIKLIFPLVLCIFPTMFVVILGPALITVVRTLSNL
jgi:tight adherence protein C